MANEEVKKHSIGMIIIGGAVWLLYLGYVNLLTLAFGVNHVVSEVTGIPLSWIINYWLNTQFNFNQPFAWRRFLSFCVISGVGWGVYIGTTVLFTDVIGAFSAIGTIIGVFTKTLMNVVLQQAITFGQLSEDQKAETAIVKSQQADYDWYSFYHGNPIQKWWKHQIAAYITVMAEGNNPILDVGCGSSPLLSTLSSKEKYGVDLNINKINFLKKIDQTTDYRVGDGANLPQHWADTFSVVICSEVIEHHPFPQLLMKELARVTKQNGYVILATPDFSSPTWNVIEIIYGLLMRTGYDLEHGTKFTESSIKALAETCKLKHIETKSVIHADMVMKFQKYA